MVAGFIEHETAKPRRHAGDPGIQPDLDEILGLEIIEPEGVYIGGPVEGQAGHIVFRVEAALVGAAAPDDDGGGVMPAIRIVGDDVHAE